MSDEATTPALDPSLDAIEAHHRRQAQAALDALAKWGPNFEDMLHSTDSVAVGLFQEIAERMGMLSRLFNIEYVPSFPALFLTESGFLHYWQARSPEIRAFIEDGAAKDALDARYNEDAPA